LPETRSVNISTLAIFLDPYRRTQEKEIMKRKGKETGTRVKLEDETMGMERMKKYCI
jgi:hypothetical protein